MRFFRISWLCILVFFSHLAKAQSDLCDRQDWFTKRQGTPTLLCRGVREAAFNQTQKATLDLERVIRTHSGTEESYRAHEVLLEMAFRQGRYGFALEQARAMLASHPNATDILNLRPLLESLSQYPEMTATLRRSVLRYEQTTDPNPHFRLHAEGKEGLFYADTGANISVMSDVEARTLGIDVKAVSSQMGDISGSSVSLQVANVDRLQIGGSVLRHVSFIVLPATQPPFNEVPADQQAILGIQVLLALKRIHVDPSGDIEIAGPQSQTGTVTPLAFHQSQPIIQMSFAGTPLLYTMDSGAVHTTLNPLFERTFTASLTKAAAVDHSLTGVGGTTTQTSLQVERLDFVLADEPVTLTPAVVLTKKTTSESEWAAGNLGYDLIKQTAPFTIDFTRMIFQAHAQ